MPEVVTKARLYVSGDPALSVSAAVVELTYGVYAVRAASRGGGADPFAWSATPPVEQAEQARPSAISPATAEETRVRLCMSCVHLLSGKGSATAAGAAGTP